MSLKTVRGNNGSTSLKRHWLEQPSFTYSIVFRKENLNFLLPGGMFNVGIKNFLGISVSAQSKFQFILQTRKILILSKLNESKLNENRKSGTLREGVHLFRDEVLDFRIKSYPISSICYRQYCLN